MSSKPCCERDTDGDGNCDRHPSNAELMDRVDKGMREAARAMGVPPSLAMGEAPKKAPAPVVIGKVDKRGRAREHRTVLLDVDGTKVRFDLQIKPGAELTPADEEQLRAFARQIRDRQPAGVEVFEGVLHRCHAKGCDRQVAPKFLMCPRHWKMVPVTIQQRVLQAYRMGQERTKKPTAAYVRAASDAVAAVARLEGR